MSESMVEKVSEALRTQCLTEFGSTWSYDVAWRLASAAIEAMSEPTEAMLENGGWANANSGHPLDIWQAMTAAALATPTMNREGI